MAKTRSQRAKEFAKELRVNKIKKSSKKPATAINKKTKQQEKKTDIQVTADLLKLCRPFSICVDRINGLVNGKSNVDFVFAYVVVVGEFYCCVIFFTFV